MLCCSHWALLPNTHSHIGINVDSHQLLGLEHHDPSLKWVEGGEKEAKPAKVRGRTVRRAGGIPKVKAWREPGTWKSWALDTCKESLQTRT